MADSKYCYPNTNILVNKLDIKDEKILFEAEKEYTALRLLELNECPINGSFDFDYLKRIHEYIFQDIYSWAGDIRTVEIGKGNLFCPTQFISQFAESVFKDYYSECSNAKSNPELFIKMLAKNYGDLNALHPFREGNGRTQREFARELCLNLGYSFDLSHTTHEQMLAASKLSFNKGDNSLFEMIFQNAVKPFNYENINNSKITILTKDDMTIDPFK